MISRFRIWAPLAVAAAGLCGPYGTMAQLLPETGGGMDVTVRPGLAPAAPPPAGGPLWQISPAISVQQQWTDNALPGVSVRPQASFITVITPTLGVSAETARAKVDLSYAPNLYHYESIKGQDRVGQNLNANSHVTLVPEEAFLDLRGFAAVQALNAGTGPTGSNALTRQNQVQSYNFSATPYVTHRFGSFGTAQIGASVSQTTQTTLGAALPGVGSPSQKLGAFQESASFTSGEAFGRVLSNVQLLAAQESGNGVLRGARRDTASYQAGYAITHSITALASAGYENIVYGGSNPLRINDATWSAGAKLLPNPDSAITVLYGHQDGVTSASLDASYAPTVRTKLFARYSEGVTTGIEQLQNSLAGAQLDPLGNPVDATTGAPLQLTNNFFGANNAVIRLRSYSLTAAWQLTRDSWQATVNRQQQTPIGVQTNGFSNTIGTYGSLAWQHELSETMRSSLFGQYGISELGSGPARLNMNVVTASAALTYTLSETLTGSVQYSYTSQAYTAAVAGSAINLVSLGLRKSF